MSQKRKDRIVVVRDERLNPLLEGVRQIVREELQPVLKELEEIKKKLTSTGFAKKPPSKPVMS